MKKYLGILIFVLLFVLLAAVIVLLSDKTSDVSQATISIPTGDCDGIDCSKFPHIFGSKKDSSASAESIVEFVWFCTEKGYNRLTMAYGHENGLMARSGVGTVVRCIK